MQVYPVVPPHVLSGEIVRPLGGVEDGVEDGVEGEVATMLTLLLVLEIQPLSEEDQQSPKPT